MARVTVMKQIRTLFFLVAAFAAGVSSHAFALTEQGKQAVIEKYVTYDRFDGLYNNVLSKYTLRVMSYYTKNYITAKLFYHIDTVAHIIKHFTKFMNSVAQ